LFELYLLHTTFRKLATSPLSYNWLSFNWQVLVRVRAQVPLQLTVGRSVAWSVSHSVSQFALSPSGTHEQILAVDKTVAVSFVMGHPPCREEGSVM
jgi:hypothetical protein